MKYFKFLYIDKNYPPIDRDVYEKKLIRILKHRKRLNMDYEGAGLWFYENGDSFTLRITSYRKDLLHYRWEYPIAVIQYRVIPDSYRFHTVNYTTEFKLTDLNDILNETV